MKAIFFNQHGDISKLKYGEIPDPQPKACEALVRVSYCALNRLDLWVLRGWKGLNLDLPHVGGSDIVGVIQSSKRFPAGTKVAINPGYVAHELVKGDREVVFPECLDPAYRVIGEHRAGGLAEFVCVPESNLYEIKSDVCEEAICAGLLTGLTAYRMLYHRAQLKTGETCLFIGAGGLNTISIKLACRLGARVLAITSSKAKVKHLLSLGAEHVWNYYEKPDWHKEVLNYLSSNGVNVIIDNVGAKSFQKSLKVAAIGARIITVGNSSGPIIEFDNRYVFTKQLSILGSTMGSSKDFEEVLKLLESGSLQPSIDKVFALEDGIEAFKTLGEAKNFGKLVIRVN